jgi:hypothetical protein
MLPSGFCSKHRSVGPEPDLSLLDNDTRLRFIPVFSTIVKLILDHFPRDSSLRAFDWLKHFTEWRQCLSPPNCECDLSSRDYIAPNFIQRCSRKRPTDALVTDVKLKPILADFFLVMFERFAANAIAEVPNGMLNSYEL